jgi:hypothetical protein
MLVAPSCRFVECSALGVQGARTYEVTLFANDRFSVSI